MPRAPYKGFNNPGEVCFYTAQPYKYKSMLNIPYAYNCHKPKITKMLQFKHNVKPIQIRLILNYINKLM